MMFFKKKKGDTKTSDLARVAALLIHAAKIDENFSKEEEIIISKALLKVGADQNNLENILKEGKEIEENSNQILDFTKEVKNMDDKKKIQIIETLWRIIYSNQEAKDREKKRKELEQELEETNNEISEEFNDETFDRYSY